MMAGVFAAQMRLGLVEPDITFLFTLVNAIIMFLIMKKFLFEPVSKFMKSREEEIEKQYADAQKVEDQAHVLKTEYEQKVSGARQEGEQIIKEHVSKAEIKAAEIIRQADEEAKKFKEKAAKEIEDERVKATAELKSSFAELTVLAASKVIAKELDAKGHSELISNVISEVGDVTWQN